MPNSLVERATKSFLAEKPDILVAIGGGSSVGLAKAIASKCPITLIAVPSTLAGSEVTSIYGITEGNRKRTGRDPAV